MIKILLADPDPSVRAAFHILLKRRLDVSEVEEAVNWEEVRGKVETFRPDLLLLECHMPDPEKGLSFQDLIETYDQILVVGMSIKTSDRSLALAAGAHAFLYKGESPEHVIQSLRNLLETRQADA